MLRRGTATRDRRGPGGGPGSTVGSEGVKERLSRVGSDILADASSRRGVRELKAILATAPDSPEAHMLLGVAYRAQNQPDLMGEAVAELRQRWRSTPSSCRRG